MDVCSLFTSSLRDRHKVPASPPPGGGRSEYLWLTAASQPPMISGEPKPPLGLGCNASPAPTLQGSGNMKDAHPWGSSSSAQQAFTLVMLGAAPPTATTQSLLGQSLLYDSTTKPSSSCPLPPEARPSQAQESHFSALPIAVMVAPVNTHSLSPFCLPLCETQCHP